MSRLLRHAVSCLAVASSAMELCGGSPLSHAGPTSSGIATSCLRGAFFCCAAFGPPTCTAAPVPSSSDISTSSGRSTYSSSCSPSTWAGAVVLERGRGSGPGWRVGKYECAGSGSSPSSLSESDSDVGDHDDDSPVVGEAKEWRVRSRVHYGYGLHCVVTTRFGGGLPALTCGFVFQYWQVVIFTRPFWRLGI